MRQGAQSRSMMKTFLSGQSTQQAIRLKSESPTRRKIIFHPKAKHKPFLLLSRILMFLQFARGNGIIF